MKTTSTRADPGDGEEVALCHRPLSGDVNSRFPSSEDDIIEIEINFLFFFFQCFQAEVILDKTSLLYITGILEG